MFPHALILLKSVEVRTKIFFNETPNIYPAVLRLPVHQKGKLNTLQADKAYTAHTERFAFTSF